MANVKATDLIDFTRASKGHALAKVSYGDELVTNGTFDTDSDWVKTQATISGGVCEINSPSGLYAGVYQAVPVTVGRMYFISVEIVSVVAGSALVNVEGGSAGTLTTSGFITTAYVATDDTLTVEIKRASGVTEFTIDNVSVKEVLFDQPDGTLQLFEHPDNIPRIEYDASGNLLGLLIEEARTNLVTNSQDISGLNQATADDDVAVAPDGTQTADKLIETTSNSVHWTYNSISATDNQDYTFSIYAKKSERTRLTIYPNDKANVGFNAVYDIDAGTVVSTPAQMTTAIEDVGNGWYRCVGTWNANTGSNAVFVRIGLVSSGTTISYQGDGTSGLFLWGQQLEAGSFPTSYIKTSGGTASRSADVATIDVDQFGFNANEGTLFAELQHFDPRTGSKIATGMGFGDGTANNRMWYYQNKGQWIGASGGVVQFSITGSDSSENTPTKFAGVYKTNDFTAYIDGTSIGTDSSGSVPVVPTLFIGYSGISNSELNGHIKSIKYYPKRLSNAKLQELTS